MSRDSYSDSSHLFDLSSLADSSSAAEAPGDIHDRVTALEAGLARVESMLADLAGSPASPPHEQAMPASPESARTTPANPAQAGEVSTASGALSTQADPTSADDTFWMLTGVRERYPAPGAVMFGGRAELDSAVYEYQWGRTVDYLLDADINDLATRLAALGHPLRIAIVRALLPAPLSTAELSQRLDATSTGALYHHLGILGRAGWVRGAGHGTFQVPATRAIPFLATLTAAEAGV